MLSLFVAFLALCVAGWALWFAVVATLSSRANQRALAIILEHVTDLEAGIATALRLLQDQTVRHTEEVKDATERIQALRAQIRDHQDDLATWTPPSKRVQ